MTTVIETQALTKYYGESLGIIDLDLVVEQGEVFGFLGPNGAGKSTTIRTLLNFLHPTRGSGTVLGLDIASGSLAIKRRTGYLPGDLALYDQMTARELFIYFANLRKQDTTAMVKTLADRFDLDLDRRIKDYSTGNRQKVGLVNAFMHEPELLILDEPTGGLDPLMQLQFQYLVEETKAQGRTIFLSSHILSEIDRVADRVGIVRDGRLVAVDTLDAFKSAAHSVVSLRFASPVSPEPFRACEGVVSVSARDAGSVLDVTVTGSIDPVIKTAARFEVVSISTGSGELEEVFLSYYSGDVDAR
jgi:ABC-2 type transport system ATP-binding protein